MHDQQTSKQMNQTKRGILLLAVCLTAAFLLSACRNHRTPEIRIPVANDVSVHINSDGTSFANLHQSHTDIQMQAAGGKLYIYMPLEKLVVYEFHENGSSTHEITAQRYSVFKTLWNDGVVGISNGYLYIERHPGKDSETAYPKKAELICHDLSTGNREVLITTEDASYMDIIWDESGRLYVTTKEVSTDSEERYQIIEKNIVLPDPVSRPLEIREGSLAEVLPAYNSVSHMLTEGQLNDVIDGLGALGLDTHGCDLYPMEDGLLIHFGNHGVPLCYISSDADVIPILTYECFSSSSSLNFCGGYAFFSCKRYEKWDDDWGYFLEPYENDQISGTYRIDLRDFSIEKISDTYYSGIFSFDDSYLFVCDQKEGVYQMDLEGNLTATLIEP